MTTINRWSPDTCSCILDVSFDETLPSDQRTWAFFAVVRACPAHTSLIPATTERRLTTTTESESVVQTKEERLRTIEQAADRNAARNMGEAKKLHTRLGSDGNRTRWIAVKKPDGSQELAEIPPLDQIQQTLEADKRSKLEFYDTLFSQRFSLAQDVYTTVLEESQRKNIALDICIRNGPTGLYDVQPDGSKMLKSTVTYNTTWTGVVPNRGLTISFSGINLTNTQKTTIRTALAANVKTAGKVTLS
jgi:hypothetical protein